MVQEGVGQALAQNVAATLPMFVWQGDADPRNNLPGRPMLDPFQSLGFLAGVGLCLWRWRKPPYAFWPLWVLVLVLPMTLSEYVPHFRRAIGVLPGVTVLAAVGLVAIATAGLRIAGQRRCLRISLMSLLGLALLASTATTNGDYSVRLGPGNDSYYAFDTGIAEMARYVNTLPPVDRVYYLPADNRHYTFQFLAQSGAQEL